MLLPLLLLLAFSMTGGFVVPLLLVEEKEKHTLDFLLSRSPAITFLVTILFLRVRACFTSSRSNPAYTGTVGCSSVKRIQSRLVALGQLKASGNSLFVIEHELDVIRHADWIVEVPFCER